MSDVNELVWVQGDDWCGVYVNGEIALQGHDVYRGDALLAFAAEHAPFTVSMIEADLDWLDSEGQLPYLLADVQGDRLPRDASLAALAVQ